MAVRIEEIDVGNNKPATRKKCNEMKIKNATKFEKMMNRYWMRVYQNTVQAITDMDAVDTGALRQSIRIEKNKTIVPGLSSTGLNEIARTDETHSAYIIAGGGGIINPKHNKEVDYATAIHDGHWKGRKTKRVAVNFNKQRTKAGLPKMKASQIDELGFSGGWTPGRPFLDEGVQRTEAYLDKLTKEFMDGMEYEWMRDEPNTNPYSASLRMFPKGRR
jgi:hypothetical protein